VNNRVIAPGDAAAGDGRRCCAEEARVQRLAEAALIREAERDSELRHKLGEAVAERLATG
jgi:hypothetical protein